MPSYKKHKLSERAAVQLMAFKDVHKHIHTAIYTYIYMHFQLGKMLEHIGSSLAGVLNNFYFINILVRH